MALAIQTELEVIDFALCPAPVGLIPGKYYRLTGLSQGSLGAYTIVAAANTATQFSIDVKVFPTLAPVNDSGWAGTFDFDTCQLTYLHDNKNNRVAGATNISVFPWFPANIFRVSGNVVEASATLNLGGNAYAGQFENNQVLTTTTLTVSGAPVASTELIINDNIWKRISFNLSTAIVTRLVISANNFLDANSLVVSGLGDIGDVFIANNVLSGTSSLEFGNTGTLTITDNTITSGFVSSTPPSGTIHTIQENFITNDANVQLFDSIAETIVSGNIISGIVGLNVASGTSSLTDSLIAPGGELQYTSPGPILANIITTSEVSIFGRALIEVDVNAGDGSVLFSHSTIMASGTELGVYDFRYNRDNNNGSVNTIHFLTQLAGSTSEFNADNGVGLVEHVTLGPGGVITSNTGNDSPQLTNVYVENGTLDYDGWPADNIRLQGTNSTLVAAVSNAKKDGYAGALP